MQDTDLSRYIPGKVKMSLPQATYKQQHRWWLWSTVIYDNLHSHLLLF